MILHQKKRTHLTKNLNEVIMETEELQRNRFPLFLEVDYEKIF